LDVYGILILFAKLFGKKIILHMTLIGSDGSCAIMNSYKFMKSENEVSSQIDYFISISSPMSERFRQAGLPHDKLMQIPNGIDTGLSNQQKAWKKSLA